MLINFKRLHHYMADLTAKYKTFRMISPFRGEIYTCWCIHLSPTSCIESCLE
ncbi:hypothetical protein Hanom_Chr01g00075651 [Helianthus anomalus]